MGNVFPAGAPPAAAEETPPQFMSLPPRRQTVHTSGDGDFSVVTYNILADCYVYPEQYPYCPPFARPQSARHVQLMRELRALDGDVVCLQEVAATYFASLLEADMAKMGYAGFFLKKENAAEEGVATFVRFKTASVCHVSNISLNDLTLAAVRKRHLDTFGLRLMQDTVGLVVTLIVRKEGGPGHCVAICNTHVYWNYKQPDVQILQLSWLLQTIPKIMLPSDAPRIYNERVPWLFCGDFNIQPNTPAYHLIRHGHLEPDHKTALRTVVPVVARETVVSETGETSIGSQKEAYLIDIFEEEACHGCSARGLASAYATALGGREPEFTNFTDTFTGCLDYVWFTGDSLEVNNVLEMPTVAEIRVGGRACPNATFPSDHLSLRAAFSFRSNALTEDELLGVEPSSG